ncbi:MAG: hypothetical protein KJO60_06185 [Desulfofustis sp.]|nr:hypothetical protein [Desulfofustis sp.]
MTTIVSFIGWPDSTKNTLASCVVAGYVESLKISEELEEIELRIKL